MKEYVRGGNKYFTLKCDKCGTYMENTWTWKDEVIWVCPKCNYDKRTKKHDFNYG